MCLGRQLTYAELDQQATVLAHYLVELGVRPDDRVAVVARRGLDTLVGLLAILSRSTRPTRPNACATCSRIARRSRC